MNKSFFDEEEKEPSSLDKIKSASIAILVLLLLIVFVIIVLDADTTSFGKVVDKNATSMTPEQYSNFVCDHLDKNINGTWEVYPAVFEQKRYIESYFQAKVPNINGDSNKARIWDDNGVMCDVPIEMCDWDYNYCMDMKMIVPINLTVWNSWYAQNDTTK